MFTPLNEEYNAEKLKGISKEKLFLKKLYYNYLINRKIEPVFSYELVHDENLPFYERVKEYSLYNHIRSGRRKINIETFGLIKYRRALFEYIDCLIDDGMFIKAKKLLNIAKEKKYFCNKYYELDRRIKKEYKYKPLRDYLQYFR